MAIFLVINVCSRDKATVQIENFTERVMESGLGSQNLSLEVLPKIYDNDTDEKEFRGISLMMKNANWSPRAWF